MPGSCANRMEACSHGHTRQGPARCQEETGKEEGGFRRSRSGKAPQCHPTEIIPQNLPVIPAHPARANRAGLTHADLMTIPTALQLNLSNLGHGPRFPGTGDHIRLFREGTLRGGSRPGLRSHVRFRKRRPAWLLVRHCQRPSRARTTGKDHPSFSGAGGPAQSASGLNDQLFWSSIPPPGQQYGNFLRQNDPRRKSGELCCQG